MAVLTDSMRAAVLGGNSSGLRVEDVSRPRAGRGEVLVRVAACGLCHTDLHYLDHGVPTFKTTPVILGHECSGTVEELGPEVAGVKPGQRVLLPAVFTCGQCHQCRRGRENICVSMKMLGNHVDGAYAQWVVAPARELMNLPDDLPLEESCIIADALTTPYHAVVRRGDVRPGDRVLVLGCGGVGLGVVQMARAAGAYVAAVDIEDEKLVLAEKLGAVVCLNPLKENNLSKAVARHLGGMPQVCFEAIGNPTTLTQAMGAVEAGGRVVVVGYCEHDVPMKASRVMFRELEIVGSLGCRPVDYPRVIEMVRRGTIQLAPLVSHRFPLESIHEGLDMLRQGKLIRGIVVP